MCIFHSLALSLPAAASFSNTVSPFETCYSLNFRLTERLLFLSPHTRLFLLLILFKQFNYHFTKLGWIIDAKHFAKSQNYRIFDDVSNFLIFNFQLFIFPTIVMDIKSNKIYIIIVEHNAENKISKFLNRIFTMDNP